MEKIAKYSQILQDLLNEMANDREFVEEEVREDVVFDTVRHHYFILWVGFTPEKSFMDKIVVHFQIRETGKIWLLANWTEVEIGEELVKRGVDKKDIVVGFYPKSMRIHMDYAVI